MLHLTSLVTPSYSKLPIIYLSLLCCFSLVGCPAEDPPQDMVADLEVDTGPVDLGVQDLGSPCATLDDCSKPECADAELCQPCEEGGNCLFTGTLKIFGRALSRRSQSISDLSIRATCGEETVTTQPVEGGRYSLEISVENCPQLVVVASRAEGTEGFVPVVRRFQMPPPVNTIELEIRLIEGDEIRCDGTLCSSSGSYESYDTGQYIIAYAHESGSIDELDNFGSIFESTDGELLWLHRFAYYDFRNELSETLYNIFFSPNQPKIYALKPLTFDTRAWVADLRQGYTAFDYHSREYSRYWPENQAERWEQRRGQLTDSDIDPDGDGRYETIEMNTYRLNLDRAQWELVKINGEQLNSLIFADVESGYNTISDDEFTLVNPDALYSTRKITVPVPDAYLRSVQSTGEYGPGYEDDLSGSNLGLYGRDYTGIPIVGSGIYAIGQPMPKACFKYIVRDECGEEMIGAPVLTRGVNHGYIYEALTRSGGIACAEVGLSESMGADFDGDGLSNERFDVEISIERPVGLSRISPPQPLIESTPLYEGSCRDPDSCSEVTLTFSDCIAD